MLWHGYINSKKEIIISRYFSKFDMERLDYINDIEKRIDPFMAYNRDEAKELARIKYGLL